LLALFRINNLGLFLRVNLLIEKKKYEKDIFCQRVFPWVFGFTDAQDEF